jgi:hypothetical protein
MLAPKCYFCDKDLVVGTDRHVGPIAPLSCCNTTFCIEKDIYEGVVSYYVCEIYFRTSKEIISALMIIKNWY